MRITPQTAVALRVLLQAPEVGVYGLQLAQIVKLPTGSVYPILARLENAGWIIGEWEPREQAAAAGRRRRRRYYRLTPRGRRVANTVLQEADAAWTFIPRLDPGGAQA